MRKVLVRVVVGLNGAVFLGLGLGFLLAPDLLALAFHLQPVGAAGLNTVRGDFGALFLGMAAVGLHAAVKADGRFLPLAVAGLCLVLLGRTVGLVSDGPTTPGLTAMAVELTIVVSFVVGHRLLRRA